ncbi:tetratricopeptide repeat protein [Thalassotalea crassostreae]|uniref:tetratricopeptide repeat protein n=1 Tax=Thalassotalea crassostreae TaxID=1763536 RepID=UPI000838B12E|nr:tetratricopeptide repeat protein [Thalassotalea crassostreae]
MKHFKFISLIVLYCVFAVKSSYATTTVADFEEKFAKAAEMENATYALNALEEILSSDELTTEQTIQVLTAVANRYHQLNDLTFAIRTMEKAYSLADVYQLHQLSADASKLIGVFNYFKGNNAKALTAYQTAYQYYETVDEPLKQAHLLNNIGLAYGQMSDQLQSLSFFQQASKLYKEYGSEQDKIDIRYNIAGLYINLNRYDQALDTLVDLLPRYEAEGNYYGLAQAWTYMAIVYKNIEQYDQSESYSKKALSYYQDNDLSYEEASELTNISLLYARVGDSEQAIRYALECIALIPSTENGRAGGGCYHALSKAYIEQGRIDQAYQALETGNQLATEQNYLPLLTNNIALYALIFAANQNTSEAVHYIQKYIDERNKAENKALNSQLARYEAEQLSQEIEKLKQNEKIVKLEIEQKQQQENYVILIVALLAIACFFVYRRIKEKQVKRILESNLRQRDIEINILNEQLDIYRVKSKHNE